MCVYGPQFDDEPDPPGLVLKVLMYVGKVREVADNGADKVRGPPVSCRSLSLNYLFIPLIVLAGHVKLFYKPSLGGP